MPLDCFRNCSFFLLENRDLARVQQTIVALGGTLAGQVAPTETLNGDQRLYELAHEIVYAQLDGVILLTQFGAQRLLSVWCHAVGADRAIQALSDVETLLVEEAVLAFWEANGNSRSMLAVSFKYSVEQSYEPRALLQAFDGVRFCRDLNRIAVEVTPEFAVICAALENRGVEVAAIPIFGSTITGRIDSRAVSEPVDPVFVLVFDARELVWLLAAIEQGKLDFAKVRLLVADPKICTAAMGMGFAVSAIFERSALLSRNEDHLLGIAKQMW